MAEALLKLTQQENNQAHKLLVSQGIRDAPGDAALSQFHRKIRQSEDENVGVEASHKSEEAAKAGGRGA